MIRLEGVSKMYSLRRNKAFLMRDLMMRVVGRKPDRSDFWALRDVSLHVQRGDSIAIVGRNGAGKSTLLGIVTGTIYPTSGTVRTQGRVSALLELGVGFHPDLTGRENVYLNAALLGMAERDIRQRFDAIVEFSEIEEFIDTPISKYSSGMIMRLGFSVAVHVDPEILILDEVFAVGDQGFQAKCRRRMAELKDKGTTFLMVSHSLESVQWFCNRAIWLEHGCVKADGAIEDVLAAYQHALGCGWSVGARDLGGNWRALDWFGQYIDIHDQSPNWIWHRELGYLYVAPDSRPNSIWFWMPDKGWLWTRDSWFPYLHRQADGAAYWYTKGSANPRVLLNAKTNQWENW